MAEQKLIENIGENEEYVGFLLVRSASQRTGKNGATYLDLTLCDCSGEINAKKWDGTTPVPATGSIVKVKGITQDFNGRLQLRIERIRDSVPSDAVDYRLLTPAAPRPCEEMMAELRDTAATFRNENLRRLTEHLLNRFEEKLMYYPGAQRIHHAERGGLLHHTTGMLASAKAMLTVYPWLNRDLLLAGVIVHDICKTEEMDSDKLGVVRDYSREGLLLGHLVLGVARIQESADELGITGEEVLLLQHMMISHHGEPEFGSPRMPMFPEAEVLHWVDLLDARLNEMQNAVCKIASGAFSDKIWSLDRRLYRPQLDHSEDQSTEIQAAPADDGYYL